MSEPHFHRSGYVPPAQPPEPVKVNPDPDASWVWRGLPEGCWCRWCFRPGAHYCDAPEAQS